MTADRPPTILCLATEFKGIPYIETAARGGAQVILLTPEKIGGEAWPWDSIAQHYNMPDLHTQPDINNAVSYLVRSNDIDRITALDDYDVATAATLREHLRLPGLGETVARYFRDKLAMRTQASRINLPVPAFTGLFNYDALGEFMASVPAPWVLKPRFEAGAVGIRKLYESEQVWRSLDELGDQQSFYLLEQFVPGDIFHVDALVWDGAILFATVSRYGAPPLALVSEGGIFNTRILSRESAEHQELWRLTSDLVQGFRLPYGVTHTEYIRAAEDGQFRFLETSARVGGAHIDRMVEAATGVSLWSEVARMDLASIRGETYTLPEHRNDYAGLIICLAREEWPDLSAYNDPEVVWRVPKARHAGVIVASPSAERIETLIGDYLERFGRDFLAHAPQAKEARTTI